MCLDFRGSRTEFLQLRMYFKVMNLITRALMSRSYLKNVTLSASEGSLPSNDETLRSRKNAPSHRPEAVSLRESDMVFLRQVLQTSNAVPKILLCWNIMFRQSDAVAHLLEIDSKRQFSLLKKMPKGFLQNLHDALGRLLLNFYRATLADQ